MTIYQYFSNLHLIFNFNEWLNILTANFMIWKIETENKMQEHKLRNLKEIYIYIYIVGSYDEKNL